MKKLLSDKDYAALREEGPARERDPYIYVRQRNCAWKTAGSVFSDLLAGWIVYKIVTFILVFGAILLLIFNTATGGK